MFVAQRCGIAYLQPVLPSWLVRCIAGYTQGTIFAAACLCITCTTLLLCPWQAIAPGDHITATYLGWAHTDPCAYDLPDLHEFKQLMEKAAAKHKHNWMLEDMHVAAGGMCTRAPSQE